MQGKLEKRSMRSSISQNNLSIVQKSNVLTPNAFSKKRSTSSSKGYFGNTKTSSVSFDPHKKTVVMSTLAHHGRVSTYQQQFTEQKQHIKGVIAQ
jgi:hypothetical protein